MAATNKNKSNSRNRPAVRIIGGRFKGRRIPVPPEGVRPTPDRVRETVFNWLMPWIAETRCLDMFAGTGALGIEALSRGAAAVVFIERDRRAADQIKKVLTEFACQSARVITADAAHLSYTDLGPFDIVFLDPPFGTSDLSVLCTLLESSGALAPGAHIYLEMNRRQSLPDVPPGWTIIRDQMAGQVRYALAERTCNTTDRD